MQFRWMNPLAYYNNDEDDTDINWTAWEQFEHRHNELINHYVAMIARHTLNQSLH